MKRKTVGSKRKAPESKFDSFVVKDLQIRMQTQRILRDRLQSTIGGDEQCEGDSCFNPEE